MRKKGTFRRVEFTITHLAGYGQYMLEAHYRGKDVKVHITDSSLWDDIDEDVDTKRMEALRSCYRYIVSEYNRIYG